MSMRKGIFTIDNSPKFEGYTDGRTWNGFATPRFTLEQANKVLNHFGKDRYISPDKFAESFRDADGSWTFDEKEDVFKIYNQMYEDTDGNPAYNGVVISKGEEFQAADKSIITLYNISDGWCWHEEREALPRMIVEISFKPLPDGCFTSPYDYPFKEHKASQQEQITKPRRDITVVCLNDYEGFLHSLPAYAGRRNATYEIKVLAENLTEDEILQLTRSCSECLKN